MQLPHPRIRLIPFLAAHSRKIQHVGEAALQVLEDIGTAPSMVNSVKLGFVNMFEAGKALGLSARKIRDLLDAGLLKERVCTGNKSRNRVTIRSLNNLLVRMQAQGAPHNDSLPVDAFIRRFGHPKTTPEVIQAIINGTLMSAGFNSESGLNSLRICMPVSMDNGEPTSAERTFTVGELCDLFNKRDFQIRSAIRAGLLKPCETPRKTRRSLLFSEKEVDNFFKTFVFSSEAAIECGAQQWLFARQLIASGLTPASGPGINNESLYIFRKSDIEAIDLESVKAIKVSPNSQGRKNQTKRKSRKLSGLTASQAASRLNLATRSVTRLARLGFLKKVKGSANPITLTHTSVEQFKKHLHDPNLITVSDAATNIGESKAMFTKRWIRSGFITEVDLGIDRFVTVSDVERINEWKKDYVTANEVADILDTNRSLLQHLLRKGSIRPAATLNNNGQKYQFYSRHEVLTLIDRCSNG